MDDLSERTPGEYVAEYGWGTHTFDPPSADLMTRVVEGLNELDSESPTRDDPPPTAGHSEQPELIEGRRRR